MKYVIFKSMILLQFPKKKPLLDSSSSASFVFETLCFCLITKDLDALLPLKKFVLKNAYLII